MTNPEDSAAPTNADRARTVASELDSLFGQIGDLPPPSADMADDRLVLGAREDAPPPRRPLIGALGALATVILVGGAVGILAQRQQWLQPEAAARTARVSMAVQPEAPSPRPAVSRTAPVPMAPSPTAPAEASPAALEVAAATPPVRPAIVPAPTSTPAPSAAPPRVVSLSGGPTVERFRDDLAQARDEVEPQGQPRALLPALDQADGRLRDAYDTALDAGVPPPVLGRYRAEWDSLRRRAAREPVAVIESYHAMADELHDYAAGAAGRRWP